MSKNSFKKDIQNRYKGRGNSWVKIEKEKDAYLEVIKFLNAVHEDTTSYKESIEREGYCWLRFSKVEGSQEDPICNFEVRFKGSKLDHPDHVISFKDAIAKEFKLLGGTPHKLQLELKPSERKTVIDNTQSSLIKKTKAKEKEFLDKEVDNTIRVIKESSLTRPTSRELESWYEFLKLNDMYEEHAYAQ